jgi:TM2 domain-containing membrane protein YozV
LLARADFRVNFRDNSAQEFTAMVDLSVVKKHSPRNLAFSSVFWSGMGGFCLGRGVQELLQSQYDWTVSLLFGIAFLAYGIFWAVMLVRRVGTLQDGLLPK